MYNRLAKKTDKGIEIAYKNQAKILQNIQGLKKLSNSAKKLTVENKVNGKYELAKYYATKVIRANDKIDELKREFAQYDDLILNYKTSSMELENNRRRDYKKLSKITKSIIKQKEKRGPLESEENKALEKSMGTLNSLYDHDSFVKKNMRDTYYTPPQSVNDRAEEYLKNIDTDLEYSKNTGESLEKKLDEEEVIIE